MELLTHALRAESGHRIATARHGELATVTSRLEGGGYGSDRRQADRTGAECHLPPANVIQIIISANTAAAPANPSNAPRPSTNLSGKQPQHHRRREQHGATPDNGCRQGNRVPSDRRGGGHRHGCNRNRAVQYDNVCARLQRPRPLLWGEVAARGQALQRCNKHSRHEKRECRRGGGCRHGSISYRRALTRGNHPP